MEARLENGRAVLSEVPLKDEGNIYVFVGEERRTLGVRATQQSYDLPSGVQADQVTHIEYGKDESVPTPPGEGRTVEEAKEAAIADGSEKVDAPVADDKVAE